MTNVLTVEFHGICVHFSRAQNASLNLPAAHRVVLPHRPDSFVWMGETVWIHEPVLMINGDPKPLPMYTTMSLGRLTDQTNVSLSFDCPPGLKSIDEHLELNPDVVVGQQDPGGIYFDIDEGTLSGINVHGSAAVRLTIETEQTTAELTLTAWRTRSAPQVISIPLPGTITVANTGKDALSDAATDFILSFAVCKNFPPAADDAFRTAMNEALGATKGCLNLLSGSGPASMLGDLGTGCSNSHFP